MENGTIDTYESQGGLGAGNNGSVRRFESQTGLERYAVKRPLDPSPVELGVLKLEGELFKKVYPNEEVLFKATSNSDGRLVMPLFPGGNFHETLKKYPNRIGEIIVAVALELQRVHGKGVIHGDIKYDNVIIEEKNGVFNAKFVDFGWAYKNPGEARTITSQCPYWATERTQTKIKLKADTSQDVFSFGWMLSFAHRTAKKIPKEFHPFIINSQSKNPQQRPNLKLFLKTNLRPILGEHYSSLAIANIESYQAMRAIGLSKPYIKKAFDNPEKFAQMQALGLNKAYTEKAFDNPEQFAQMQDLGLNKAYTQKAFDNPEQFAQMQALGLNKAYTQKAFDNPEQFAQMQDQSLGLNKAYI
ncbi:hypothetical protein BGC07_04360 [Piscirickettsia litoralis]|uniref:Protein kinase domain-containing protein n=1 Tax=Piscirickettsia litoralis TaxID=1891921 RepID=A0ABX3A4I7_9GAMM|nr:hypothetical protein BGC07_04360 [Piscirickettsia litoralis]